jgi:hypothetical protein
MGKRAAATESPASAKKAAKARAQTAVAITDAAANTASDTATATAAATIAATTTASSAASSAAPSIDTAPPTSTDVAAAKVATATAAIVTPAVVAVTAAAPVLPPAIAPALSVAASSGACAPGDRSASTPPNLEPSTTAAASAAYMTPLEVFMATKIMPFIRDKLSELTAFGALPRSGISAFDPDVFTSVLHTDKVFECTLPLDYFDMWYFPHGPESAPPIGAVVRVYETLFVNAETKLPDPSCVEPVLVRVTSATEHPIRGNMQRLNNCAYYFAFLYAWAQAQQMDADLAAKFARCARSFKVRFVLIADRDEYERYKWSSNTEQLSLAENVRLVGMRRAMGFAFVRDDLKARGKAFTAAAVAAWFKTVKLDEEITLKVAERYLRLHARVAQVPGLNAVLDTMESMFGPKHTLTNSSHLDMLVGASKCKTEALQHKILEWLVCGIFVYLMRTDSNAMSREVLKDKIQDLIFKRKVLVYLHNKFPFLDEEGVNYIPGREPSKMVSMCLRPLAFHKLFPRGRALEQFTSDTDASSSAGWLTQLLEVQHTILAFIRDLVDDAGAVKGIMKAFLSTTPLGTAEAFLGRQDLVQMGVFDLDAVKAGYLIATGDGYTDPTPEPVPVQVSQPVVVPAPIHPPQPTEPDMEHELEPEADEPQNPAKLNSSFFKVYVPEEAFAGLMNDTDPSKFHAMVQEASHRVDRYCEFHLRPTADAAWDVAVARSQVARTACDKSRTLFFVNPNTASHPIAKSGKERPWRAFPVFPEDDVKRILKAVVGDKEHNGFFGLNGSSDMLVVSDGRNWKMHHKLVGAIRKMVPNDLSVYKKFPVMPFRLSYSNQEFSRKACMMLPFVPPWLTLRAAMLLVYVFVSHTQAPCLHCM